MKKMLTIGLITMTMFGCSAQTDTTQQTTQTNTTMTHVEHANTMKTYVVKKIDNGQYYAENIYSIDDYVIFTSNDVNGQIPTERQYINVTFDANGNVTNIQIDV